MSADVKTMLLAAAPEPSEPPNLGAIRRRGDRLRLWRRTSVVVAALPMLGGLAWAGGQLRAPHPAPPTVAGNDESCHAEPPIAVFLRDMADAGEVDRLSTELEGLPHVQSVTYFSKADAYAEFKRIYKDQPEYWEDLPEDALPASLRVAVDEAQFVTEVMRSIPSSTAIEDVRSPGRLALRSCHPRRAVRAKARLDALRADYRALRRKVRRLMNAPRRSPKD